MSRIRRTLLPVAALTAVLGLVAVPLTTAAYTDRASARADGFVSPETRFHPQNTWTAGTAVALQEDGTIAIWGYRGNGLSGTGVATVSDTAAISLVTLPADDHPEGRRPAIKVAGVSLDNYYATDATYTGLAALSDDGRVYTWGGTNTQTVMGRSSSPVPYTRPGQVDIPGRVIDLVSTFNVFLALTDTGDLYTWGYAQARGVTGQGGASTQSSTPRQILDGVHSIGAGGWAAWAIRGNTVAGDSQSGVLWWGWANSAGSFAGSPSGEGITSNRNVPTQSAALSQYTVAGCEEVGVVAGSPEDTCGIQKLSGSYYGNQAILSDGRMLAWGNPNEFNSGGPTTTAASAVPTAVALPDGVGVQDVAPTQDYVLLLGTDGLVYVYGRYSFGGGPNPATGARSTTNIRTPTALTVLGQVESLATFGYSGQVRTVDGRYVMFGGSYQGANANRYQVVRDQLPVSSTTTGSWRPPTELVWPGTGRAAG